MINAFQIYAHIPVSVPALSQATLDFQITDRIFVIDNRVSNISDLSNPALLTATMNVGGSGGAGLQNQNAAVPPSIWLPPFRVSEAMRNMALLRAYEKMSFTYANTDPNNATDFVQTAFLGHQDYPEKYALEYLRPFNYYTAQMAVPAFGGSVTSFISIQPSESFLVRAFFFRFMSTDNSEQSLVGSGLTLNIRDMASSYNLMNTPILVENCCSNFIDPGTGAQANAVNWRPRQFAPWIAPKRHQYEIKIENLGGNSGVCQFGMYGNLINYTKDGVPEPV